MRAPAVLALAVGSLASGAAVIACFDLFHSTGDLVTACEIDATTAGCVAARKPDAMAMEGGVTDFCAWTSDQARQHAQHACAWLGACETPMGKNAFGSCMLRGLLAFDCAANPNHRARGKTRDLWGCLALAQTCRDVDACVFPNAPPGVCPGVGDYTTCANPRNGDVRVECQDGGGAMPYSKAHGENCALWGQTCEWQAGGGATCSGRGASDAGPTCPTSGCYGSTLHYCSDGVDVGIDCAGNGAMQCDGFPSRAAPSWVACVAESDAGAAAQCSAGVSASCSGTGIAASCPSGVLERIDCRILLGSASACAPGDLAPPFDWTSPCSLSPPQCSGDSCDGGTVLGCERGAAFGTDCKEQRLGPCRMVTTDMGAQSRAACTPP
jgi:hypothetical protein